MYAVTIHARTMDSGSGQAKRRAKQAYDQRRLLPVIIAVTDKNTRAVAPSRPKPVLKYITF